MNEFMWGPRDEFIMCCGNDGGLYEWKFTEESKWERKERNLDINTHLHSLCFNDKWDGIFLSGGEGEKGWWLSKTTPARPGYARTVRT